MARYLIQSSHTNEECLKTLDEFVAQGDSALNGWEFGCAVGDHSNHIAYSVLDTSNEADARGSLPPSMQGQAQITEVGNFTADQVRSFHN